MSSSVSMFQPQRVRSTSDAGRCGTLTQPHGLQFLGLFASIQLDSFLVFCPEEQPLCCGQCLFLFGLLIQGFNCLITVKRIRNLIGIVTLFDQDIMPLIAQINIAVEALLFLACTENIDAAIRFLRFFMGSHCFTHRLSHSP